MSHGAGLDHIPDKSEKLTTTLAGLISINVDPIILLHKLINLNFNSTDNCNQPQFPWILNSMLNDEIIPKI